MMSENEEPPAKVLKIDNIDGVKRVTELSDIRQVESLVDEMEIMGEESGIISGGADVPEHEDGQEEWLSEGILTDDDYNPGSQDSQDADDRTDSQLGTDDDHLNDSKHLNTTVESEANVAESEPNLGLESECNIPEGEEHLDEMETLDSCPNSVESQTYTQEEDVHTYAMQSEANIVESEANLAESEANIAESEANIAESEANMIESEANIAESETNKEECESNMLDNEANILESTANIAESEANTIESEANTIEGEANTIEGEANVQESEANIAEIDTNKLDSEANMLDSEGNVLESEANIALTEAVTAQSKANVTESLPTVNGQASKKSNVEKLESNSVELNIEETMEHLDGNNAKNDVFDSLLNDKSDTKIKSKSVKEDTKIDQDDGNDTDDLLRMLGEDDNKSKKKLTKTVKDIRAAAAGGASSDDDDFVYEGATIKKLKAAKNALAKKQPATKAVPEDMEDGDDETDGEDTQAMLKMFNTRGSPSPRSPNILTRHRGVAKSTPTPNVVVKKVPIKTTASVVENPPFTRAKSTPLKQYQNKRNTSKSLLKPSPSPAPRASAPAPAPAPARARATAPTTTPARAPAPSRASAAAAAARVPATVKLLQGNKEPGLIKWVTKPAFKPPEVKTPAPFKSIQSSKPVDQKTRQKADDEAVDEEDGLNEDDFNFDEDEYTESDLDRQRIMRPEMMDEEIPSDGDSHSEDGSLYDELPSSDSEDMDDWFQLDIRAEKAGDYIPLLGPRAKELLLEEKLRVSARLHTLQHSLAALTHSGRRQAERLRDATMALAELDDLLKAS